jgi:hypothetical protein
MPVPPLLIFIPAEKGRVTMTTYKDCQFRTVRRHGQWYAEVFLDGEFRFVTGSPCGTEAEAAAAAREVIDVMLYGDKRQSSEW